MVYILLFEENLSKHFSKEKHSLHLLRILRTIYESLIDLNYQQHLCKYNCETCNQLTFNGAIDKLYGLRKIDTNTQNPFTLLYSSKIHVTLEMEFVSNGR